MAIIRMKTQETTMLVIILTPLRAEKLVAAVHLLLNLGSQLPRWSIRRAVTPTYCDPFAGADTSLPNLLIYSR